MPILKTQLKTNSAGLRQKNNKPYNKQTDINFDEGYFPLKPTVFPQGTPLTSERSKKVYSDLADEREFLLKIREQWVKKLEDLKKDNLYLKKMKDIKKSEIGAVEPLFAKEQNDPVENSESSPLPQYEISSSPVIPSSPIISETYQPTTSSEYTTPLSQSITSPSQPISSPSQHISSPSQPNSESSSSTYETSLHDQFYYNNDHLIINGPSLVDAYEDLEEMYQYEEEEEEEDEERSRIALNLMLQQFGDSI